ncbi:hypothetical protein RRG08_008393 [Elysia crispata]|uniref:Uncharacterized protein n=1 Tax=Elysia crispata TaxID=231223 RepID=A0AAE1BD20_9GAST|nr:hypothetical protein RRG08_008393 [Elysia crispata]
MLEYKKGQPFFKEHGLGTKNAINYTMKQDVVIRYAQGKEQSSQITEGKDAKDLKLRSMKRIWKRVLCLVS